MKYKDLDELMIEDWNGVPFRALTTDDDTEEVPKYDEDRLDGVSDCVEIIGYCNERWLTSGHIYWKHVYPIELNKKPKKRMTYRQLAMWLQKQRCVDEGVNVVT